MDDYLRRMHALDRAQWDAYRHGRDLVWVIREAAEDIIGPLDRPCALCRVARYVEDFEDALDRVKEAGDEALGHVPDSRVSP